MYVFDTSTFINGKNRQLPPETFPGVWEFIEQNIEKGAIIAPKAVLTEIKQQTDELFNWAHKYLDAFVDPSRAVQQRVGEVQAHQNFPNQGTRNEADPWVVAEALERNWTVVSYEGRAPNGEPTRRVMEKIPGVCKAFNLECITLPEALGRLGAQFVLASKTST
ncbi:MAG: DUF4411 family protein [Actinomycetia bacterium]|nr:DUF4411 family protein [Actinomycetes bacterium]